MTGIDLGRRLKRLGPGVLLPAGLAILAALLPGAAAEPARCGTPGTWLDPATGAAVAPDALLAALAKRPVVLLGESHDNAEHHRWQLQTMAALHGREPRMVLGFEMFPRRVQPALDRWVEGELDVEAFLAAAEWRTVWNFDPALYLPLFHFARQNRIPMVALNVDRALVARVGREGWVAVPRDERAGLSDPAPAGAAYRKVLAQVFAQKQALKAGASEPEDGEAAIAAILRDEDFGRFVEAQLTWDRAMAERLAEARRDNPGSLVVGIAGRGHIDRGHGIPRQLADLGIPDAAVLVPVGTAAACDGLAADLADAAFVVEDPSRIERAPPKPKLGIMIETAEGGVRVMRVVAGSVAEAADLAPGDLVVAAAGFPVETTSDLIEIVQRQAPGTWLPLEIRRDNKAFEAVAKFPGVFGPGE